MTVKHKGQAEGQGTVIYEGNQGPATPGTAARCEICGFMPTYEAELASLRTKLAAAEDRIEQLVPEIERLKAENASLLGSLRAAREAAGNFEHNMMLAMSQRNEANDALAAAEQRAEAAEKALREAEGYVWMEQDDHVRLLSAEQRNTELEGALRPLLDALFVSHGGAKKMRGVWVKDSHDAVALYDAARAALHDEERSAPPQEPK